MAKHNTKGFKIICNNCNKLIDIKKANNDQWDINDKKALSIYIADGHMNIKCSCGNEVEIINC